ncbi:hypothetical protein C5167_029304 [Papaver somniferum]|nr:hypothetical protein C5167_029304 [Papaver somniferum]
MTELNEAKSSECIVLSIETGRLAANRLGLNLKVIAFPSILPKPLESNPSLRPLSKIPHCCPPWESELCLSPSVDDHPKRPSKHHRLGHPLLDQLPNTTRAHQRAVSSLIHDLARTLWQIPTRYAPVRHFVLNSSTKEIARS